MNTLQEILENSDREFEEEFVSKHAFGMESLNDDVSPKEIKSFIHARDKKLLEAVVGEIEKMKETSYENYCGDQCVGEALSDLSFLLQDLIK